MALSWEQFQKKYPVNLIRYMCSEIIFLKPHPIVPGANELYWKHKLVCGSSAGKLSLLGYVMAWKHFRGTTPKSMVSYQKGPTRHAYAWQIGPFGRIPPIYA